MTVGPAGVTPPPGGPKGVWLNPVTWRVVAVVLLLVADHRDHDVVPNWNIKTKQLYNWSQKLDLIFLRFHQKKTLGAISMYIKKKGLLKYGFCKKSLWSEMHLSEVTSYKIHILVQRKKFKNRSMVSLI